MSNPICRPYRPGDEIQINDGFNRVFGLSRAISDWQWKYPSEPEGRWLMLACDERGTLLAHYGAVPVQLQTSTVLVRAGQIGDVFTVPETRHGLGAARTYIATVRAFFAEFGAPEKLALLYGFPGDRALRLGLKRLGYDQMVPRPVQVWRRPTARRGRLFTGHGVRVGFDGPAADDLWRRAKHRYRIAAVRDSAWLSRRFTGRPGVEYVHLAARRGRRDAALAVFRPTGDTLQWAELVWDGNEVGALAALEKAAVSMARARGASSIEMWLDGDDAAEDAFTRLGWGHGRHPAGLVMVARSFHPGIDVSTASDIWYVTMSDADLV